MSHQNYPAQQAVLVTPSDSTPFAPPLRAISFSVAGPVQVIFSDGTDVTIPSGSLAPGIIHPIGDIAYIGEETEAQDVVGYR